MKVKERIESYWFGEGHVNEDQRDFFIETLQRLKPKACLETGFASGRSTVTTLVAAAPEIMVSVDLSLDYLVGAREHAQLLQNDFPHLKVVEGNSVELMDKKFFKTNFPSGVDYAFIDGDHTYAGCRGDLESVLPHLNMEGVIMVDDYHAGQPNGAVCPPVDMAVDAFAFRHGLRLDVWQKEGKGVALISKRRPRLLAWLGLLMRVAGQRWREVRSLGSMKYINGISLIKHWWRRYVPDRSTARFNKYNKQRWGEWRVNGAGNEILLDWYTVPQTQIARSYFLNVLAQRHKARLVVGLERAEQRVGRDGNLADA